MASFGENLKKERIACGYSQAAFAKAIGTSQQRVSEWECNRVESTLYTIIAIERTLDIAFDDLTDGISE